MEDVAKAKQLGDLTAGVVQSWLAEAEARALLERRATLVRLARRKFDAEATTELGALLGGVSASEQLAEIANE